MRARVLIIAGLWALAVASVAAYFVASSMRPVAPARAAANVEVVDAQGRPILSDGTGQLPVMFSTPAFEWTDHRGRAFGSDDLAGRAWVAFIFLTHCPTGSCPLMIGQMADLQEAIPDERVQFVSFSVDPERDTPEALARYVDTLVIQRGGEVSDRWRLLTADDTEEVDRLVRGLKLAYDKAGDHSTLFLLVDGAGKVRGIYGHTDPDGMAKLARDAAALLASPDAGLGPTADAAR